MDLSSQEEEGKKKVTEVKTFPVPFALGEIQEKITINTNTPSKPSKEQIINQAIQLHLKGNIPEAAKCYKYCINQGFIDHRVFSNYAGILQGIGKSQDAEISLRKAIELKPDYAEAHSNLGNILRDLGKLQDAEISLRKAIELKPDFADAHLNLGNILRDLGKLQDAEISLRKAIELKPDFADAHLNLGNIFKDFGQLQDAFNSYLKAIDINPRNSNGYTLISELIRDSDPSHLNKLNLQRILNLLLERNDIPHKDLFNAFNFLYSNKIISNLEKIDSNFSKIEILVNEKLIINALKKIIFKDTKLEKLLTNVRKYICYLIAYNIETISDSGLQFIIALGEQCFWNEYVYSITEEDKASLNIVIKRCQNNELNETNISILSCYNPLYKLLDQLPSLKSFNSYNQNFKELIELQITEPLKEVELSQNIKKLGLINDNISQKVKSQYEENPYPRWKYHSYQKSQKLSINQAISNDINPSSINHNIGNRQLKVLIAGCGTGQHILNTQRYKNAQITGIDLSLSSLAYAQRKINELGIDNVQLIQMDILEVALLEMKFDIIECSGVLHHMNDPAQGLKALVGILNNNGFLKLGLYSELARKNIVSARNYISNNKLQYNKDDIRDFRQKVISGELSNLNSLQNRGDFYSLSECRDLCFHTQEQRFTINQLQETLKSNELEFLGFLLPQKIKSLYKQYFPKDKTQTNLQNWRTFEEKNPNTFAGMYQFWVCKTQS